MNPSTSIDPPAAKLVEAGEADADGGMNRFAALLDRLAYEPGRNAKLRLLAEYLRSTPDPERGWALAALTGALSFAHAKPGIVRALIAQRVDPVLFEMSYDSVGDLSETIALMWPRPGASLPPRTPSLSEVITTLAVLGKLDLPAQLAQWLDALDDTGRWAMLKLVTGALRIGVSARLAKTAVAVLGNKDPNEVELIWPSQAPPYPDLFAWLEGRADKPTTSDPAPFRPVMLAHALEEGELGRLDPAAFIAEWKWDGIRVQAAAGTRENGQRVTRLYTRTGEDISHSFPDLTDDEGFGAVAGKQIDGLPRFIVELDPLSGHQRVTCRS
jgi:DNA ligase-1